MALFKKKKRDDTSSMQTLAEELGLRYAGRADQEYLDSVGPLPDLPLLREGSEDNISQLVYGELDGIGTQIFNFEITTYAEDDARARSCILFTHDDVVLPEVFIAPRDRQPRLGEKLREGGVAVGSTELMQRFSVQARSREHASNLISPEVDAWLVASPIQNLRIEMREAAILGHVPDLPGANEFRTLLEIMRGFHKRIPDRVWQEYRTF